MKTGLIIAALAGCLAMPAAATDYTYNMVTGILPDVTGTGMEVIGANVVRGPKFTGEKDEKVQAMDQAKTRLDSEYCQKKGMSFVPDNGFLLFDAAEGSWMVGGLCR